MESQQVSTTEKSCNHGLVPPRSHGRAAKYGIPSSLMAQHGQRQVIGAKDLTRSERMINRIGRLLTQQDNVHVAVALDGATLVISANKEVPNSNLTRIANLLKRIIDQLDPLKDLSPHENISAERREKDINKVRKLLNNEYTEEDGIELNNEIKKELITIKNAINAGVIDKNKYIARQSGIYVITTQEDTPEYNMHGELKVTSAIKERRQNSKNETFADVFIGGTWVDCLPCNASHKMMNSSLPKAGWQFYSAGTHGGIYPGYRTQNETHKDANTQQTFKDLTGINVVNEASGIKAKAKYRLDSSVTVTPEARQLGDESDSDSEDTYQKLKYKRAAIRQKRKGDEVEFRSDVQSFKEEYIKLKELIKKNKQFSKELSKQIDIDEKELIKHREDITEAEKPQNEQHNPTTHSSKNSNMLTSFKNTIEEKLNSRPATKGKKVKWNTGNLSWVPDGDWEVKPFSRDLLETVTNQTRTRIKAVEIDSAKELKDLEQSIKANNALREKIIRYAETQISKLKLRIDTNTLKVNELTENEKNLLIKKEQCENDFCSKYKLTYKDVTIDEEEIENLWYEMDNFQDS